MILYEVQNTWRPINVQNTLRPTHTEINRSDTLIVLRENNHNVAPLNGSSIYEVQKLEVAREYTMYPKIAMVFNHLIVGASGI